MIQSREEGLYFVRLAESTNRYDDMVTFMKEVTRYGQDLSGAERNLLSKAFKNAVG